MSWCCWRRSPSAALGSRRQPVSGGPRTATYDRYGELLQLTENLDYDMK